MKQQLNPEQKEEVLRRIKRSAIFQRVFSGADGEFVLDELKKEVRGFDPDPYISAYNSGVRSICDFIQTVLNENVEKAREVLNKQK